VLEYLSVDAVALTVVGYPLSYIEAVGTVLYLLSVWLVIKRHMLTWPIGLASSLLFMVLFYQIALYSDALEQFYYFGACVYGWVFWSRSTQESDTATGVRYSSRQAIVGWAFVTFAASIVLALFVARLHRFLPALFPEPASYPFFDALTTVMSFSAMWLLARKRIESWAYWIAADLIGIGLYYLKSVRFISLLYVVLLFLAIRGFVDWRRIHASTIR